MKNIAQWCTQVLETLDHIALIYSTTIGLEGSQQLSAQRYRLNFATGKSTNQRSHHVYITIHSVEQYRLISHYHRILKQNPMPPIP